MTQTLIAEGIVFTACAMFGQSPAPAPAFEVASIKPNISDSPGSSTHSGKGQISMENVSLKQCIETAFNVKDYSLSGPSWLDNVRFDILAKLPAGYKPSDVAPMLQTLLVERFQLAVHRESKILPSYALLVDKKGAKIQSVEVAKDGRGGWGSGRGSVDVHGLTMTGFADVLSANLDRPVKDLTDLKGVFEFKLKWTTDETPLATDNQTATSLFAAVQEQLGLKLEARKLPIEILVIDHIEKVPTGN